MLKLSIPPRQADRPYSRVKTPPAGRWRRLPSTLHEADHAGVSPGQPRGHLRRGGLGNLGERAGVFQQFRMAMRTSLRVQEVAKFAATGGTFRFIHFCIWHRVPQSKLCSRRYGLNGSRLPRISVASATPHPPAVRAMEVWANPARNNQPTQPIALGETPARAMGYNPTDGD